MLFRSGGLNSRKGPDVLFEALKHLKHKRWELKCIGEGHLATECKKLATNNGFASQVDFQNFLPYNEAMEILANADLAVVPSRHDGWGAVVNEALMRGIPVVCTNHCGASELLTDPFRGTVVPAGDANALGEALSHWHSIGPLNTSRRAHILNWANQNVLGECGAEYFHKIMNPQSESREVPAWLAS